MSRKGLNPTATFVVAVNDRGVYERTFLQSTHFKQDTFRSIQKQAIRQRHWHTMRALLKPKRNSLYSLTRMSFSWRIGCKTIAGDRGNPNERSKLGRDWLLRRNSDKSALRASLFDGTSLNPWGASSSGRCLCRRLMRCPGSSKVFRLSFDEHLPGFHLYGTDICMQ